MEDKVQTTPSPAEPMETKQKKNGSLVKAVFEYVELFAICVCVVFLTFSFLGRITRVRGKSMYDTLEDKQPLITTNLFYTPKAGDIVVFHQTGDGAGAFNEVIIKRVIATGGQTVRIDFANTELYVDGVLQPDEHASFFDQFYQDVGEYRIKSNMKEYDALNQVLEVTVPEGYLFVMGDNRNHSSDSRNTSIGFVDERRVIGHAIISIYPFSFLN